MKTDTTEFNITAAANGYVVNKQTVSETQDGDKFSSDYKSETFVFTDWDAALDWLRVNGK